VSHPFMHVCTAKLSVLPPGGNLCLLNALKSFPHSSLHHDTALTTGSMHCVAHTLLVAGHSAPPCTSKVPAQVKNLMLPSYRHYTNSCTNLPAKCSSDTHNHGKQPIKLATQQLDGITHSCRSCQQALPTPCSMLVMVASKL